MEARVTIDFRADGGTITACNLRSGAGNNVSSCYTKHIVGTETYKKKGIYVQGGDNDFRCGFIGDPARGMFGADGYYGYNGVALSETTADPAEDTNKEFEKAYPFPEDEKPAFSVTGTDISSFVVVFDEPSGEYAPNMTLTVDGADLSLLENHKTIFLFESDDPVREVA